MNQNPYEVIELTKEHLGIIIETSNLNEEGSKRLVEDYENGYFNGILCKTNSNSLVHGYIVFYYSYSTWEAKVIYITKLWTQNYYDDDLCFTTMCRHLIEMAKCLNISRINYNLDVKNEKIICDKFQQICGAIDLTEKEKWEFWRMDHNIMKCFISEINFPHSLSDKIKVRKINIYKDAKKLCKLIMDLAEYEKLSDQVRIKCDDLIEDYQHMFNNKKNGFYDCFIATNITDDDNDEDDGSEIIGCAWLYYNYSIERGRGCYLEDFFVKQQYRLSGLGTYLWKLMANECFNHGAKFMEWNCLQWNEPAIKLYLKSNAYNTTKSENLHVFRITRDVIHDQSNSK